jgi:hypothetical protein
LPSEFHASGKARVGRRAGRDVIIMGIEKIVLAEQIFDIELKLQAIARFEEQGCIDTGKGG